MDKDRAPKLHAAKLDGSDDGSSDPLRRLPASDWLRLWANLRAKHLPEAVAREVQLSITGFSLDAITFVTAIGLIATAVMSVTLVPLSSRLGQLWVALQTVEFSMVFVCVWYLQRSRRRGTLTAAQYNRFLIIPTIIGGISWGSLPAVVGTSSLVSFYLALMISALACSIGYFWTIGHWPLSMLFALIILTNLTITYLGSHEFGQVTILLLGPLLFLSLLGISANAQFVLVRSYYYEATARDRERTIGLILQDYERGGQDFLWETDPDLNLTHVPTQMMVAGRGDPRVGLGASLKALLVDQPQALEAISAGRPFNSRVVTVGPDAQGEVRLWGEPKLVEGRMLGYRGVGSDSDAARRALEAERTTERLDAMVALTSGLAHDFNNQLATILGAVELAALDPAVPEGTLSYLNRAVDACLRTRRITGDLVVASGYDATYQATPFTLGAAVDEVVDDLRTLFPDLDLMIRHRAAPWVVADRDHYMRAVRNLMQNACQAVAAMPRDFRRVKVLVRTVRSTTGEHFACTDIVDCGPGVPAELTERIFEPFSTTRRSIGGTGLGLSVARGFAHQAGGSLTLEPSARGAAFRLLIPLADSPTQAPPPTGTAPSGSTPTRLNGRFLVVEDDRLVADNVATLLRSFGGTAEVACSVAEAIENFSGRTADVECVISDLVLPDGEGYEVIAALRREHPNLRAIYMSGFTPTLPADVAPDLRCPFIAKPFSAMELASVLDSIGVSGDSTTSTTSTASECSVPAL